MSRAFTLVETLITAALFAVLMLAIAQLYILYGRVVTVQQSSINVSLGASRIMEETREAGLQAKNVIATHTFPDVTCNSGETAVAFEIPSIDASGSIITGTYDYVCIYVSSAEVYKVVEAAPGSSRTSGSVRLSDAVEALSFTYDNSSFPLVTKITANATTSAIIKDETTRVHLREQIYLRNL